MASAPATHETISVGPLSSAIDLAAFKAWLEAPLPQADIEYARGMVAPRLSATYQLAGEHARAGLIHSFHQRVEIGGKLGTAWIARRRGGSLATDSELVERAAVAKLDVLEDDAAEMLRLIRQRANLHLVCHTNREFAADLKLDGEKRAAYLFGKLIVAKLIKSTDHGPGKGRTVTVTENGMRTATPRGVRG